MVYLDNAASTPPEPDVLAVVAHAAETHFGNPSSAHGLGAAAARALETARAEVAGLVRGEPNEVVFTSGGTEANALGVLGAIGVARGRHVVATAIEHPAVLRNVEALAARGYEVTFVAPGADGVVRAEAVVEAVREETALVAVMLVNNELGTIQPVAEIARALKRKSSRAHLHVDAVQAAAHVAVDVRALGASTVALSAHKLHGPKGVGALWLRAGVRLSPVWDGGRQERGLRSGTENVPGIVGFGRAASLAQRALGQAPMVAARRDRLESKILTALTPARRTVPLEAPRVAHIASLRFPGLPAEPLLHALEARGVYVSAGSACASKTRGPSHVLRAIGLSDEDAVLRFSLSRQTTDADLDTAAANVVEAVAEIAHVARGARR